MPMKYTIVHEQTQPIPPDSLANTMNICNVISIYMVTVIITPDAITYYRGITKFAISYTSHAYHMI